VQVHPVRRAERGGEHVYSTEVEEVIYAYATGLLILLVAVPANPGRQRHRGVHSRHFAIRLSRSGEAVLENSFDSDVIKRALDNVRGFKGLIGSFSPPHHAGGSLDDITLASVVSGHNPKSVRALRERAPGA
jgi:hypothetical protein